MSDESCETPEYEEGPCHCAYHDPDTDRRERYVDAILEALSRHTPGAPNWHAAADAAMAVADEELTRLRAEWHQTVMERLEHVNRLKEENARLRAKVETETDYSAALEQQIINMGGHQAAADDLRATIARVEAVLDEWYGSDVSYGRFAQDVFAAVKGEQP